jgi:hypothetical protein
VGTLVWWLVPQAPTAVPTAPGGAAKAAGETK